MTIASEIERIRNGVSAVYTKLEEKGATLPEEQSLENICDTVDTVPVGGETVKRGNWIVPQEYIALDKRVLELSEEFVPSKGNYSSVFGMYYDKTLLDDNTIKFNGSIVSKCYTINGDVTSSIVLSDPSTYTFSENENWMIFCCSTGVYGVGLTNSFICTSGDSNNRVVLGQCAALQYINCWSNLPESRCNLLSLSIGGSSLGLKSVHSLVNEKLKFDYFYWPSLHSFEYIPPVAEVPVVGVWSASTPFKHFALLPNLPDGYDFSGSSDDWDFSVDITTANGDNLYSGVKLKRMYVTLPKGNVTMNGKPSYWNKKGIMLTADNWTYIAQHAPTVSGKTLTINQVNADRLGATNKALLESKGWTVTVLSS